MKLEDLKVGDEIAIYSGGIYGDKYPLILCRVKKITEKQIVADNGRRFNKRNGYEIGRGDKWWPPHIASYNDAIMTWEKAEEIMSKEKK